MMRLGRFVIVMLMWSLMSGVVYGDIYGIAPAGTKVRLWDGKRAYDTTANAGGKFSIPHILGPFTARWTVGDKSVIASGFVAVSGTELGMETALAAQGRAFSVRVPSNPSTGYGWSIIHMDESAVRLVGNKMELPQENRPGAGGVNVLTFGALKKGDFLIILGYSRIWEDVPPASYHVVAVSVR